MDIRYYKDMPACIEEDCVVKRASFNTEGESIGIFCSKHKKKGMINIVHKRCTYDNCRTRTSFNTVG